MIFLIMRKREELDIKMKKRILILLCSIILVMILGSVVRNINNNNEKVTKKNTFNMISSEDILYSSLNEIRTNSDKVVNDVKNGIYSNISADNVVINITDADNVSYITISPGEAIGENKLAILQAERDILDYYLGNDCIEKYFIDNTTYLSYEEAKKAIENDIYKPINDNIDMNPWLAYTLEADTLKDIYNKTISDENYQGETIENTFGEGKYQYGYVMPDLASVWINKGKIYSMEEQYHWTEPEYYFDLVEEKDIYDIDLNNKIKLSNGEITIENAVEFVQDYFDNRLPYNVNNDVKKRVDEIKIIKCTDDTDILCFRLVRSYNDLSFEGENQGAAYMGIPEYIKDCSFAYMIDVDDIDIYFGVTSAVNINEEKSFVECVSLQSALQLVSQSIGSNSEYKIFKIETIYRNKIIDGEKNIFYGIPCWKISGRNITSDEEINFYVNMENGELDYESIPKMINGNY